MQADDAASLLSSLAQLDDTERIDAFLSTVSAAGIYSGGENEAVVRAALLLAPARAAERIAQIITRNAHLKPGARASLLARPSARAAFAHAPALLYPAATVLVETLLGERVTPAPPESWQHPSAIEAGLITDLLTALGRIGAAPLAERLVNHVLANPDAFLVERNEHCCLLVCFSIIKTIGFKSSIAKRYSTGWGIACFDRVQALPVCGKRYADLCFSACNVVIADERKLAALVYGEAAVVLRDMAD